MIYKQREVPFNAIWDVHFGSASPGTNNAHIGFLLRVKPGWSQHWYVFREPGGEVAFPLRGARGHVGERQLDTQKIARAVIEGWAGVKYGTGVPQGYTIFEEE
jgi:hypothetical protein